MLKKKDLWAVIWDEKDVPIMVDESDGGVGLLSGVSTVVLGMVSKIKIIKVINDLNI